MLLRWRRVLTSFSDGRDELILVDSVISVGIKCNHSHLEICSRHRRIRQEILDRLAELVQADFLVTILVCLVEGVQRTELFAKQSVV